MSFLDGLFESSTELTVAPVELDDDATIEPGGLYRVLGNTAADIDLTLAAHPIAEVAGKRLAIKVIDAVPEPTVYVAVIVPAGQLIESDDGELGTLAECLQDPGTYREWLCDSAGTWWLVAGTASSGGDAPEPVPPLVIEDDGVTIGSRPSLNFQDGQNTSSVVTDDLESGSIAVKIDAKVAIAKAGVAVGARSRVNLIEGANVTITAADDAAGDEVDVTIAATVPAGDITSIVTPGPVLSGGAAAGDVTLTVRPAATFTYAAARTLDVAAAFNHRQTDVMTGDMAITLSNPATDLEGAIWIRQDAAGNRSITSITAAGYTTYSAAGTLLIDKAASAVSILTYSFCSVGGVNILFVGVITLKPVI